MEIYAATSVGCVRTLNEDAYFFAQPKTDTVFAIVADGMGGHNAGEVASGKAVEVVQRVVLESDTPTAKERLLLAVEEANREIFEMSRKANNLSGMGTTITACIAEGKHVTVAQVGDSRLYHLQQNEIAQITHDHSLVEMLVRNGEITEEEAKSHPQKNIITRAVGTDQNVLADLYEINVKKGDVLLLCSDGLINMVENQEILSLVREAESMQAASEQLILKAEQNGGIDNITVILMQF